MTSEVKARLWDKRTQQMTEAFNLLSNKEMPVNIKDCEVMLFTSFHDVNGRNVCEGDLYKTGADQIFQVFFKEGAFCGGLSYETACPIAWIVNEKHVSEVMSDTRWITEYLEVVGNVHQNPELLRAKIPVEEF